MDWLEREWYDKLRSIGMSQIDAELLARIKAQMERDTSFIEQLKRDGFTGFCRWVEIKCKDIYNSVKSALRKLWDTITGWF